jgi:hypothetical protein
MRRMTKYDPLTRHLATRKVATVPMSFPELERLLGFALPPSARKHRAWWSNNPTSSVVTKAWLAAGYQSRHVDLEAERLVFVKLNAVEKNPGTQADHPLLGWAHGSVKIAAGVDLTDSIFSDAEMDRFLDAKAALIASGLRR